MSASSALVRCKVTTQGRLYNAWQQVNEDAFFHIFSFWHFSQMTKTTRRRLLHKVDMDLIWTVLWLSKVCHRFQEDHIWSSDFTHCHVSLKSNICVNIILIDFYLLFTPNTSNTLVLLYNTNNSDFPPNSISHFLPSPMTQSCRSEFH